MKEKKAISRVTRTKEQARISYNKMSRWYDRVAGSSENKYRVKGLQNLEVQPGEKVLEIGFGTGRSLLHLAKSVGTSGKVHGIDLSEEMYRIAQTELLKQDLAERAELICGDGAQLPFVENHFDAVFLCFTLELFDTPEIPVVLNECLRVLNRDGRVCIVALSRKGRARLMVKLYEWVHWSFPSFVDCRPIYLQEAMEEAGFQIIETENYLMWGLPVEIVTAKKE